MSIPLTTTTKPTKKSNSIFQMPSPEEIICCLNQLSRKISTPCLSVSTHLRLLHQIPPAQTSKCIQHHKIKVEILSLIIPVHPTCSTRNRPRQTELEVSSTTALSRTISVKQAATTCIQRSVDDTVSLKVIPINLLLIPGVLWCLLQDFELNFTVARLNQLWVSTASSFHVWEKVIMVLLWFWPMIDARGLVSAGF